MKSAKKIKQKNVIAKKKNNNAVNLVDSLELDDSFIIIKKKIA